MKVLKQLISILRQKYQKTEDIAVKEILSLLMEVLEAKYAKMGIFLKR